MRDQNYKCGVGFTDTTPEIIEAQSHYEEILKYYSLNPSCDWYIDTLTPSLFVYSILEDEGEFTYISETEKILISDLNLISKGII